MKHSADSNKLPQQR